MAENPFMPFVWLDEFERTPFEDDQWHEFATPRRINYGSGEWAWAYISTDAARAWQALRDWLNGNQYQWYARGYEAGYENRRERAKR